MRLGDLWGSEDRGNAINKYLWAMLLAVLREIGEVGAKELAAGLSEYLKEAKTPDGWTREEYLTYAIGRLQVIRRQQIGPFFVDNILDMATDRLIDHLEGKLNDLNEDPEPPPVEPLPEPDGVYDVLFPATPDPLDYVDGDKLWERRTTDPTGVVTKQYRVTKGVVGYQGETMIGYRENEVWTLY